MKLYKVVAIIVSIITIIASLSLLVVYIQNTTNNRAKSTIVSNTESSYSSNEFALDSSKHLSDKDIKNIMKKTDSRVEKVNDRIHNNYYKDYYDGDIPMFKYFENEELSADYFLYYDERGKLIYADITHYRAASYSIYYYNDELLHVEVGPFLEGELSINGDMANVESVIKQEPRYAFVLEDNSLCLEHGIYNKNLREFWKHLY